MSNSTAGVPQSTSMLTAENLCSSRASIDSLHVNKSLNANTAQISCDNVDIDMSNSNLRMSGGILNMLNTSVFISESMNLHFGKLHIRSVDGLPNDVLPCKEISDCEIFRGSTLIVSYDSIVHMAFTPFCYHCTHFNPDRIDFKKKIADHYKDAEANKKLESI